MISDDALRPLLGTGVDRKSILISAPASGWRNAPKALIMRELNRVRSRSGNTAERVTWAASSGKRPRYPALRQSMLSGYIWVTLPTDSPVAVMRTTSEFTPTDALHIGSGGGMRQRGTWQGKVVLARFGLTESPSDPTRHYRALQKFRFVEVPEPIGHGEVDDVTWAVESFRSGRPPRQLTNNIATQVSDFLAKLPTPTEPSDLVADTSAVLANFAVEISAISESLTATLHTLPPAVNHGDVWSGNLLFDEGRLVGVIDWDSWQPRGVPGIDLIHLYAEDVRRSRGTSYGDLVDRSFWADEALTRTMAGHFVELDLAGWAARQDELAAVWWMTATSGALRRTPTLADNQVWMDRNVHRPARRFGSLLT